MRLSVDHKTFIGCGDGMACAVTDRYPNNALNIKGVFLLLCQQ
jgi:hypothetical protein